MAQDKQTQDTSTSRGTSHRGFAAMDEEKQRRIASQGGHAAHEKGTAHEFTSEEARIAGRKGGEVVSQDRRHMAEIGRKGGEARGASQQAANRDRTQDKDGSTRGGSPEQHAKAGAQSHENG